MRERSDIVLREQHPHAGPVMPYAPTSVGAPPPALPPEPQDPQIFSAIFRHWWLVVLFALIGAGAALLYLQNAQKLYTSYAKLYIDVARGPIAEAFGTAGRENFLNTQCEYILSTPLLAKAAERVGEMKTFEGKDPAMYLKKYTEAEVGRRDDLVTVLVYSPHAEEAAQIVNAVVETYKHEVESERETSSTKLLRTLRDKHEALEAEVRALEAKMLEFRQLHPNLALEPMISARLQQISQELVNAQLAVINARSQYAAGHPVLRAAQKREEELFNLYEQAMRSHVDANAKSAEYQRMHVNLQTQQTYSQRVLEQIRSMELAASQLPLISEVRVLEPPRVEPQPSWPRKYRTLAVALFAGVLLGCGLALLRDRMDTRMRSVEEIQTVIGLPVLGVVPAMSGRRTAVARAMTVHLDPRSVVAESYRTIRTAVYFGCGENRCKTLLITSPEPGDGKTTSASNLAIAIAQTGRSVLLLDADFRKPTQHKNLDIKDSIGLSSVLAGREPIAKAIQHTGVEGLDILPCGPIPANPSEILNSREFGELVDRLAAKYDHIIFDSPPVNAVTDARILGAVCDVTILVLRADKSTRTAGEHARNALLAVGARVLGVIVNDAPRRKGYEVYGGSYYGGPDISVRTGLYEERSSSRRRLPHLADEDEDDPRGRRRDIA